MIVVLHVVILCGHSLTVLPMQRIGDLYYVFLTMEMNERGYKIKGPH